MLLLTHDFDEIGRRLIVVCLAIDFYLFHWYLYRFSSSFFGAKIKGTQDVMLILTFLGSGLFFLGLFVLDSLTAVGVGFFSLFVITAFEALQSKFCGLTQDEIDKDNDDDGDLHDPSGAVICTKYLDFEMQVQSSIHLMCIVIVTSFVQSNSY